MKDSSFLQFISWYFNFKNSARMKEIPLLKMFLKLPDAKLRKAVNTASETEKKTKNNDQDITLKEYLTSDNISISQPIHHLKKVKDCFIPGQKKFSTKVCKFFLILFQLLSCIWSFVILLLYVA